MLRVKKRSLITRWTWEKNMFPRKIVFCHYAESIIRQFVDGKSLGKIHNDTTLTRACRTRIVPSRCRRARVIVKFRPENTKNTLCLLLNARTIKRTIIRLIMISPVYTGVRARPSRSRSCRPVRSRCRHARFVAVTFLRGFDGVIVFFFPMCCSTVRTNRPQKTRVFRRRPIVLEPPVRRVPYTSRK